jgi:putative transposase
VLSKLPERERERARLAYWRALDEANGVEDGARRLRALIGELDDAGFAAAAACLADDLDALCVHLRYPLRHRRRWRSTNLLERSLGEVRRRTKVIGHFPGETSCLSLCWAVLDLVISHSNGVTFTDLDRQAIDRLSRERAERTSGEEVIAA